MIDALGDKKLGVKFVDSANGFTGTLAYFAHTKWEHLAGLTNKLGRQKFKNFFKNNILDLNLTVLNRIALTAFKQYTIRLIA
jgi:hypothetical protein